jgi:hypothetical protein
MKAKWVRSSDVVWEEIDGEAVIVKPSTKRTWVFNTTAAYIWKYCDGHGNLDDVARQLASSCGRELRQIRTEIKEFCQQLEEIGLIVENSAPVDAVSTGNVTFRGSYFSPSIKLQNMGLGFRGRPSSRNGPGSP